MLGEREAWAKNQATYYDYYTTMLATTATTTTAAATSTIIYNSMPFFSVSKYRQTAKKTFWVKGRSFCCN